MKGDVMPIAETCAEDVCYEAEVILNDENIEIIRCTKGGWKLDRAEPALAEKIGNEIFLCFE